MPAGSPVTRSSSLSARSSATGRNARKAASGLGRSVAANGGSTCSRRTARSVEPTHGTAPRTRTPTMPSNSPAVATRSRLRAVCTTTVRRPRAAPQTTPTTKRTAPRATTPPGAPTPSATVAAPTRAGTSTGRWGPIDRRARSIAAQPPTRARRKGRRASGPLPSTGGSVVSSRRQPSVAVSARATHAAGVGHGPAVVPRRVSGGAMSTVTTIRVGTAAHHGARNRSSPSATRTPTRSATPLVTTHHGPS